MDPPLKRRRLAHASKHQHAHANHNAQPDGESEDQAIAQFAATFRTVPQRVEEIHVRIQTQALPARLHQRQGSGSGLPAASIGVEVSPVISVGVAIGGTAEMQASTAPSTTLTASTTQPPLGSINSTSSFDSNSTAHDFRISQSSSMSRSNGTVGAATALESLSASPAPLASSSGSGTDTLTETTVSTATDLQTQTTPSPASSTTALVSGSTGTNPTGASDINNSSVQGSPNSAVSRPGAIAGGVVGGAAGLALLVLMVLLLVRWSRRRAELGHHALQSGPLGGTNTQDGLSSSRGPGMAARAGLAPFVAALPVIFRQHDSAEEAVPASARGFTRVSGRKLPSQFSAGMVPGPARSNSNSSWLRDPFGSDGGSPPGEMALSPGPQRMPAIHGGGPYHALDRSTTSDHNYGGFAPSQRTYDRSTTTTTLDNRASRFTEEV